MALVGNLILRLIVIAIGYVLACAAASAFISLGFFSDYVSEFFSGFEGWDDFEGAEVFEQGSLVVISIWWFFAIAAMAAVPFFFAVLLAEGLRWSGMVINIVLGGFVAFAAGILAIPRENLGEVGEGTLIVLFAMGFVAGFVYWAIAGNSAGKWLGERSAITRGPSEES